MKENIKRKSSLRAAAVLLPLKVPRELGQERELEQEKEEEQ